MTNCSTAPSWRPLPPGACVHKPSPALALRIDVHLTDDSLDEGEDYCTGCYNYGECKTDAGCTRYVRQPITKLGIWVIEAGPADGNWSSLDSVMILSASANASTYMLGQDVDLTGFALHPVRPTQEEFCTEVRVCAVAESHGRLLRRFTPRLGDQGRHTRSGGVVR